MSEKYLSPYSCKTREDVYNFIKQDLQPVKKEEEVEEVINDELWNVTHGFRYGFNYHNLFYNSKTEEYAFHISNDCQYERRHENFPIFGRYNSYDEMIEGIVDKYCKLWKINY